MSTQLYDVLIIGGGPAVLSMATALARRVYTALILDSGKYRNARALHVHAVPGFYHANPANFRAKLRDDLRRRYKSIHFKAIRVTHVRQLDGGHFEAIDVNGYTYRGKKVGLATGVQDIPAKDMAGYDECWGRGVFHCLFCHGFEERGADSVGVLAGVMLSTADIIVNVALSAKRLSRSVTIYASGIHELIDVVKPLIRSTNIMYDDQNINRLELQQGAELGVLIHSAGGSTKIEGFIASHPEIEQRSTFAAQLGLKYSPTGGITVTAPMNETSVK